MSDSVRPHRRQPTRLLRPWDFPGKNTGVGCHCLLQCMKAKLLRCVWLLVTSWTAAYQAPPSMGFSRQEYWSGVPLPSPFKHLVLPIAIKDCFQRTEPPILEASTQQRKTLFKDGLAGVWASETWFKDVAPGIPSLLRLNSMRYRCPASLISSVPQEQRITLSSPHIFHASALNKV